MPELAAVVCTRTGSAAVLDGSITRIGSQYVLGLRAKRCDTGDILDEEQAQAARKEDVLTALGEIGTRFRARVGESVATLQKHSTPLPDATTTSLEALKAYTTASKLIDSDGPPAALPHFKRAAEIDPNFAMAHAQVGLSYSATGESGSSIESTTKAYQLRERASDPEKFFIDFVYYRTATGDLPGLGANVSSRHAAPLVSGWFAQRVIREIRNGRRGSQEGHDARSGPFLSVL